MNIDSRVITLALFLVAQSIGAIWWASSLSSEVGRVALLVDSKIPALEKEARVCGTEIHNLKSLISDMGDVKSTIKGMDVVLYRLGLRLKPIPDGDDPLHIMQEDSSESLPFLVTTRVVVV